MEAEIIGKNILYLKYSNDTEKYVILSFAIENNINTEEVFTGFRTSIGFHLNFGKEKECSE